MSTEEESSSSSPSPSSSTTTMQPREWDLVVYGATGDAGTAIAMYVANNIDAYKKSGNTGFRWAIAGRSEIKLNRVRSRIIVNRKTPSANDEIGVLTADVSCLNATGKLAKSTRVLVSAVGPYTLLGESVYRACVQNGTNYVDITGEVDWVASMRTKYQSKASETGSTLCSFAGYDCVPCDITMHMARKALSECECKSSNTSNDNANSNATVTISSAETVVLLEGGAMPRGTIRTMISKSPEGMSFWGNLVRYVENSDSKNNSTSNARYKTALALFRWLLPRWSPEFGAFTVPHFMGWCNIPVVYNSHGASLDCTFHDRMALSYSKDCPATGYGLLQTLVLYSVLLVTSPGFLLFSMVVEFVPQTATLLLKIFDSLDYSGSTPQNQQELDDSTVEVWNYATSATGAKASVHLQIRGDAGIKATALLASETAFAMLELSDKNELPRGRIGSPSEICGDALVERLQSEDTGIGDSVGLTVTVTPAESDASHKKED